MEQSSVVAEELGARIRQVAANAGATDEHRALNYLVARYPAVYTTAAEAHERGFSLNEVEARPSSLSGARRIVDVIFSYTHRQIGFTEKYFVRLDVTGLLPSVVTGIQPFYDR
jgi:hypothetical protein